MDPLSSVITTYSVGRSPVQNPLGPAEYRTDIADDGYTTYIMLQHDEIIVVS